MPETPEIDQKITRLKRPFKCGHWACGAYSFGYGRGDQEPFDFRDPFLGSAPTNKLRLQSVKKNERSEALGIFYRIEIVTRGFKRVSVPKIIRGFVS